MVFLDNFRLFIKCKKTAPCNGAARDLWFYSFIFSKSYSIEYTIVIFGFTLKTLECKRRFPQN